MKNEIFFASYPIISYLFYYIFVSINYFISVSFSSRFNYYMIEFVKSSLKLTPPKILFGFI